LKELDAEQKTLPALINPKLGNKVYLTQQLIGTAPQIQMAKLDQVAALPLGARIKLDPWGDKVEMVKNKPVALISEREKMPLGLTPFLPYLTYYSNTNGTQQAGDPAKAEAKAQAEATTQPPASEPQPQAQPQPQPQD